MIRRLDEATLAAGELPHSPETETKEGALEDLNQRIHQALDKVRFDVSASQFIQERLASIDPRFAPQQKITELRETHERLNLILLEAVNKLEQDFMRLGVDPDTFENGFKHFQLAKKIVAENMGKQSTDLRLEKATLLEKTRQARSLSLREKLYPIPPTVREEELVPSVEPEPAPVEIAQSEQPPVPAEIEPVVPDAQEQITAPTESFLQFQQHVTENWDKQIDNETIVELRKIAPALTEAELVALTSTMEKQLPPEIFEKVNNARQLLEEAKHTTSQEDLDAVLQKRNDLMEAFASAVKAPETAKVIRTIAEQYTNDKFKEHLLSAWDERLDKDVSALLKKEFLLVSDPKTAKQWIDKDLPAASRSLIEQARSLAAELTDANTEAEMNEVLKKRNTILEQFASTLQTPSSPTMWSELANKSVFDVLSRFYTNVDEENFPHFISHTLHQDVYDLILEMNELGESIDYKSQEAIAKALEQRNQLLKTLEARVKEPDNGLRPESEKEEEETYAPVSLETVRVEISERKKTTDSNIADKYFETLDEIYGEFYEVAKKAGSDESRRKLDAIFADFIQYEKGSVEEIPVAAKEALLDAILDVYRVVNGHPFSMDQYYSVSPAESERSGGQSIILIADHLNLAEKIPQQAEDGAASATTGKAGTMAVTKTEADTSPEQKIDERILKPLDALRSTTGLSDFDQPELKRLYSLIQTPGDPTQWHEAIKDDVLASAEELLRAGGIELQQKIAWNEQVAHLPLVDASGPLFSKKGIDQQTIQHLIDNQQSLLRRLSDKESAALSSLKELRSAMGVKEPTPNTRTTPADIEEMTAALVRSSSDPLKKSTAA